MTKKAEKQQEKADALKRLREIVKPGDELYTILRHRSTSGMQRAISVVKIDGHGRVFDLDYLLAGALDMRRDDKYGGLKIGGGGMDMGFDLVYNLSSALYGYSSKRGYRCLGDRCPSNSHVNDRTAPRGHGVRHKDGYAVSQRWL